MRPSSLVSWIDIFFYFGNLFEFLSIPKVQKLNAIFLLVSA